MESIALRQTLSRGWVGLLVGLTLGGTILAQGITTGETSSTPGGPDLLTQLQQEQQVLGLEFQSLIAQGATEEQLQAWHEQNAAGFEYQQQLAHAIADESASQPIPIIDSVNIPANASTALADFLTTAAALANAHAEIHNELLQSLFPDATQEDIELMQDQEEQTFLQEYGGYLQLQSQRAQAFAARSASLPLPIPGPELIPSSTPPAMQAFLVTRNAFASARAKYWNQFLTADPGVAESAMGGN